MKVLFATSHFGFLRNFEAGLRALAERGHQIHLLADRRENMGGSTTVDLLTAAYPNITVGWGPPRKDWLWQPLTVNLRLCLDYWRYLQPRYANAHALRERAATQVPAEAVRLTQIPVIGSRPMLAVYRAMIRRVERAAPIAPGVTELLEQERPDIVVVTPLLYFGSQQVDYVRAAKRLGIPTLLAVGSWDHLTTKGLIHEVPDRLTVWNEAQRAEAGELHGIASDRVTVTGSPAYDHWFVATPSMPRDEFCAHVGLPMDRPIVLYLCSSPFITPHEVGFVRRWMIAVRASQSRTLATAAILVRPHPQNADQWRDVSLADLGPASIWPSAGANPVDAESRATYFNSMYYSAAVAGVNTSALIESGIVGRPVFSVQADEFAGTQEGTLHFQHLKNVNGGLLTMSGSLAEHEQQLAAFLDAPPPAEPPGRKFVEAFIRPHGLDQPAGPRLADAIEDIVRTVKPLPQRRRRSDAVWATLLRPVATAAYAAARQRRLARKEARAGQ
ncbi:MAG TPA: hypothetical protein VNJ02_04950 [Vicinamibacterales bacterium]|nr:hypothetical protein [Vicinamibacterales bacterium]